MGKDKKAAVVEAETEVVETPSKKERTEVSYEERVKYVSEIASPLASKKLTRKLLKTIRKGTATRQLHRGVKEVVKAIRKNQTGFVVFAGDISPIDVLTHVPVYCEEHNVPYIYVPSKEDLGTAGSTKRPTSCIMLTTPTKGTDAEYVAEFQACLQEVKAQGAA